MFAVLSDIHGNFEALRAVFADIDQHHVERILCLGDLVGHGPEPVECITLVCQRCEVVIRGDFDHAAFNGPDYFPISSEKSMVWFNQLCQANTEPLEFLASLSPSCDEGQFLFVHGSARNTTREYLFPEDIYNTRKMQRIFDLITHVCFCGHTHLPGVFIQAPGDVYQYRSPEEINSTWHIDEHKTIINVGSVGQPRDGDPRACYVLVEGDTVRFRRVEYDIAATVTKIYAIPELENFLGDRLRDGR